MLFKVPLASSLCSGTGIVTLPLSVCLLSIRGDMKVKPFLEKALKQIEGRGGGHEHAVGASIKKQDFTKFIDIIKKEVSKATHP